jgi:hypothetical protein
MSEKPLEGFMIENEIDSSLSKKIENLWKKELLEEEEEKLCYRMSRNLGLKGMEMQQLEEEKEKLLNERLNRIKMWFKPDEGHNHHSLVYGHKEFVGSYDCNKISDEWWSWFLMNPSSMNPFTNPGKSYETGNVFLLNREENGKSVQVYFTAASPFQRPDFRTLTITKKAPLLVPVYNMSASLEDFPSIRDADIKETEKIKKLEELILDDLSGIRDIKAAFDKEPIYGCCVLRNQSKEFQIADRNNVIEIPEDRLRTPGPKIHMCHGGYWLFIRQETIKPGDHLLEFKAESRNYEIEAKILINALI